MNRVKSFVGNWSGKTGKSIPRNWQYCYLLTITRKQKNTLGGKVIFGGGGQIQAKKISIFSRRGRGILPGIAANNRQV